MDANSPKIQRFGPFEIDLEQRLLFRAGDSVPLTPKAFDTLAVLVAHSGKIVDKADLLKLVWPDTFVEENNLTQNISALRRIFGDEDYIETIPRRGYRFRPGVTEPNPPAISPKIAWAITAVLTVAALIAGGVYITRKLNPSRLHRVDSLVVLPFVNLTAGKEDEYFSDGLTEEITNAVAHLQGLRVVARTSAFQFKNKARDIRSIAQQLQVGTVLEGSVRRQANLLRVTAQLIDAESGYHIWSRTYDREDGNIFKIQEEISNELAHAIRQDAPLATARTRDLETYNLYLLGRFHRGKPDQPSIHKAMDFFQQAIARDPRYAAPYAGLAECYMKLAQQNAMPPLEAWAAAQKAVDQALALDDNLAEAHTTQAIVHLLMDRNWPAAEKQFRRAIALNGNDAAAHHWFSHYFAAMGHMDQSLAESRTALTLDPLDVQISSHLIFHFVKARDYPSAIKAGRQTLELDPNSQLAYLFLRWAYEAAGEWHHAINAAQRANAVHPDAAAFEAALKAEGPRGYWRVSRDFASQQKHPDDYRLAIYHARLGEIDQALKHLGQSSEKHEPDVIYLKSETAFDSIHDDPRFQSVARSLNLP